MGQNNNNNNWETEEKRANKVHFGHCAYAALTAMELNMRNY